MKINRSFRYISISHKNATVTQRDKYHIAEEEKATFINHICTTFSDISGLLLLVTCNRTEIYYESETSRSDHLLDFLISLKEVNNDALSQRLFEYGNTTEETVQHLLNVSSGLASTVLGDAEIIHQIKKAYQFSIAHQLQGSLLERAMQAVFKNHKRISNETHFRDGTTSTAYKSLKVIEDTYTKASSKTKKILFIGAGDIVIKLFKYNSKFNYTNIFISNRTEEKAIALANKNQSKVYSWDKVLANDFQDFDVIISAVSNNHHLIKNIPITSKEILLIDLAMPCNIDTALASQKNTILYNLDTISAELETNKATRLAAIDKVHNIINEELSTYIEWLHKAPQRESLVRYKKVVSQKIKNYLVADAGQDTSESEKLFTDQIMRKLIKKNEALLSSEDIDAIIDEQFALSNKKNLVSLH